MDSVLFLDGWGGCGRVGNKLDIFDRRVFWGLVRGLGSVGFLFWRERSDLRVGLFVRIS